MSSQRFRNILNQRKGFLNICHLNKGLTTKNTIKPSLYSFGYSSKRLVTTYEPKPESLVQRIFKKIPFLNVDIVKTKACGYLLYENIADRIDYVNFMEKYKLPDTFYSWFVVTEMHIWMLSVRAMAEDNKQGRVLRNSIVEALWADVAKRAKKLGSANPAAMRTQISDLSEQLQASFIAYDEGLQLDDIVLAGALWRRLYQKEYAAPHHLEDLVRYIRKHIAMLDNLTKEQILDIRSIKWEGAFKL